MSLEKVEKDEKKSSFSDSGMELLFGEIDSESARDICEWILRVNFEEDKPSLLNLVINSEGGNMSDAFAIIDVMKTSLIPIRTVGLGQVQSAGLMIFLAGSKGERILTPNTCIMSHQYSWGSSGKHHELVAVRKEFDMSFQRQLNHYMKCTGLDEKVVKKYLLPAEDIFLSATDALKYGICDRVASI